MPEINQIFSPEEPKKILEVNKAIVQTDNSILKMSEDINKLIKALSEQGISLQKVNEVQKEAVKTNQDLDAVGKQLQGTEEKLKQLSDERQKTIMANRAEIQKQTNALKQNVIITTAQSGAYNKINVALNQNIAKWKQLSEAERNNSQVGGKLLTTIQQQDAQLKKLDAQIGRSQRNVGNYSSALAGVGKRLIGAFGVVGGVMLFAQVLRGAFSSLNNFTKAQSELQAISGKTREELKGLTEQAKLLGAITQFTATQVTQLQIELAKLGFTTNEINLSTKAILNFATATGSELPAAAKTAGTALRVFNLDASRMEEITAKLAVATTKSALTFSDYDTILSTVGPVAKSYGFSLEDLLAVTGKLKDAGFDATKGSTAFRNILLNLVDTGGKLSKELGGNIDSFDKLIPALIGLREKGVSLNETLQLTDKRSVAAFNQFLTVAESSLTLRDGLVDVNDQLQIMVDKKLDNMAGDITKLSSAWEGFVLKGEEGTNIFRIALQFITDLIIKVSNLDLIFKRSSKLSEKQVSRTFDVLMSITDKKAQKFRDVINKWADKINFSELMDSEKAFKIKMKSAGFTIVEIDKLWDEYLKRRTERNNIELTAEGDKNKALLEIDEKQAAAQREIDKKNAAEAEKRNKIEQDKINKSILDTTRAAERELRSIIKDERKNSIEENADSIKDDIEFYMEQLQNKLDDEVQANVDATDLILEDRKRRADEAEKLAEQERQIAHEKAQQIAEISGALADTIEDFASGRIKSFKDFSKQILLIALDSVQKQLILTQVEILAKEIASKSFAGIATSALLIAGIQIAFAGAKAAIQSFEHGTENSPDKFIAGEKGRELMKLRSGELMIAEKATYFEGNKFKGATIYNNKETERIIVESRKRESFIFYTADLKAGLTRIEKAIQHKPVAIHDKSGRIIGIESDSYKEIYLNRLRNGR